MSVQFLWQFTVSVSLCGQVHWGGVSQIHGRRGICVGSYFWVRPHCSLTTDYTTLHYDYTTEKK